MIKTHPFPFFLLTATFLIAVTWLVFAPLQDAYYSFLAWIYTEQRSFHKGLTAGLSSFADNTNISSGAAIIISSLLYGIFHAAGPGHGKVILTTYLLSQPEKVGKSIILAICSALVQGLVAVILVYGLFYLFDFVSKDIKYAVIWSERLAFTLIILLGLTLLWRGLRRSRFFSSKQVEASHNHSHDHAHHTKHGEVCSTCGHAHIPTPEQVDDAVNWRTSLGIVLSIGMRPCTGAVLVLIFSQFYRIPIIGLFAVLAMSVGTAFTISILALVSVYARNFAVKKLSPTLESGEMVGSLLAVIGGLILVILGWGLLSGSLSAPLRPMGI